MAKVHKEQLKLMTETEKAGSIASAKLADDAQKLDIVAKSNDAGRKKVEEAKKEAKDELDAATASADAETKRQRESSKQADIDAKKKVEKAGKDALDAEKLKRPKAPKTAEVYEAKTETKAEKK